MNALIQTVQGLLAPAVLDRLVLALNHLLAQEPQATARLLPHAGRVLRVQLAGLPPPLPSLPPVTLRVTRAGMVERVAEDEAVTPDLQVSLPAERPAQLALQLLGGQLPALQVEGDAQLAAEVDWLFRHLRWDMAEDLQPLVGPAVAGQIAQAAGLVGGAMRSGLQVLLSAGARLRGG